jgi:ferritin-like metal-binding protein YciE
MANAASAPDLAKGFREHLQQVQAQVDRPDRIFSDLGKSPKGNKCEAMDCLRMVSPMRAASKTAGSASASSSSAVREKEPIEAKAKQVVGVNSFVNSLEVEGRS